MSTIYTVPRCTDADLAFAGDLALLICGIVPDGSFVREDRLLARERRDTHPPNLARLLAVAHQTGFPADEGELAEHEMHEILRRARLTPRQRDVVARRLTGQTFEEISGGRTSRQAIQQMFLRGIEKIREAFHAYAYAGLADVYRWEVRRGKTS